MKCWPIWKPAQKSNYPNTHGILLKSIKNVFVSIFTFFSHRFLCDPKDRLLRNGISSVMAHPFFEGVDWTRLRSRTPPFVPKVLFLPPIFFTLTCVLFSWTVKLTRHISRLHATTRSAIFRQLIQKISTLNHPVWSIGLVIITK